MGDGEEMANSVIVVQGLSLLIVSGISVAVPLLSWSTT